jgi:acyl-CoA thioesterase
MESSNMILQTMLARDNFSKWLGIIIDEHKNGYCRLHFIATDEMLNGFGIVHGGILFSAADSAFAFACNSDGQLTVALEATINFIKTVRAGELITAEAKELHKGNKTGVYEIRIENSGAELIALFKGTSYRTGKRIGEE